MTSNFQMKTLGDFIKNQSGETAIQTSLVFSLAVIVGVAIGIPMLSTASKEYAYQKQYGVDTVQTSSVSASESKPKRYTIRKSVLDVEKDDEK